MAYATLSHLLTKDGNFKLISDKPDDHDDHHHTPPKYDNNGTTPPRSDKKISVGEIIKLEK